MNKLLTDPDFTKDFVVTPEPNAYLIGLHITPEQAEVFAGHDFISICVIIDPDGHANLPYIYSVNPDGAPGDWRLENSEFNPAQIELLQALEERSHKMCCDFYDAVQDDLDEFYEQAAAIGQAAAMRALQDLLGDNVNVVDINALSSGETKLDV